MKDKEPKADSTNTGDKGTADSSKDCIPTRHVLAWAKKADSTNTGDKGMADCSKDCIPTRHVLARAKKNSVCLGTRAQE